MTAEEMYDYILTQMTAEEALRSLLRADVLAAGKMQYDMRDIEIPDGMRPFSLIVLAAKMLGWDFALEEGEENMRGISIGTKEYLEELFKNRS